MNKIIDFEKQARNLGIMIDEIKFIENALKNCGGELFLIGGNVRDLILKNKRTTHSDLVCDLPINLIVKALAKKKIKISKAGLKYGSITAHIKKASFDVTSMRQDLETDGRYATVKFTDDLNLDAERRDFTINAIYCDTSGNLMDPCDGIRDLKHKKVRFIGKAEDRIKEDYLRILRFIRFSLLYSKKFDSDGFNACNKLKKNILNLSMQRRINELGKILILENIKNKSVISKIVPFFKLALNSEIDFSNFDKLCRIEKKLRKVSKTRRIKFLIRNTNKNRDFSKIISKDFSDRIRYNFNFKISTEYSTAKQILEKSEDQIYDNILINYADGLISGQKANSLLKKFMKLKKKFLPINGYDLLNVGFIKGRKMGKALLEIEKWWIKNKFKPDKKQCLNFAKKKLLPTS